MENTLTTGLHYGVPAPRYHADPCPTPSLSSGAARTILAKSPAHVQIENPRLGGTSRESTAAMDTGALIHAILSGNLDEIGVGDFPNYLTKAAKEWRDETRAAGKVPVLAEAYVEAEIVSGYVRARAAIGITNSPFDALAKNEVTAIWREGDVYCRARYDVLRMDDHGNADVFDWKTTKDISDRGIEKSIANFRYDIQAAFYLRGLEAMGLRLPQLSFCFVFIETAPPYTVRRVVLSQEYLAQARKEVSQAIALWQQCLARNAFPTTPPDTLTVEIPHYLSENDGDITID
jgi:hypothetical protein